MTWTPEKRAQVRAALERLSDQERIELAQSLGATDSATFLHLFAELARKTERGEPWTLGDHARAVVGIARERFRLWWRR